jgi:hypothetical protein
MHWQRLRFCFLCLLQAFLILAASMALPKAIMGTLFTFLAGLQVYYMQTGLFMWQTHQKASSAYSMQLMQTTRE